MATPFTSSVHNFLTFAWWAAAANNHFIIQINLFISPAVNTVLVSSPRSPSSKAASATNARNKTSATVEALFPWSMCVVCFYSTWGTPTPWSLNAGQDLIIYFGRHLQICGSNFVTYTHLSAHHIQSEPSATAVDIYADVVHYGTHLLLPCYQ
ncbi:uncharacterized protein isoform X2 [Musca autumnalis]|uniref:uncharacterized protein isoform X2 n=1 Tax=Musca autumnalis TaxID=221902 RepID=UPI003CE9E392